jgi:lysyl endopeptidase
MKKALLYLVFLQFITSAKAQVSLGGVPFSWRENIKNEIPVFQTANLDMHIIRREDEEDDKNGRPLRFGYLHDVQISINSHGKWQELDNGDKIWQLEVMCPEAKSINFTFDKFWLPPNGKLFIYNLDKSQVIGAFSELNNKGTLNEIRGFATGLVYGDRVIIEYYQPKNEEVAIINIAGIIHGYRYLAEFWSNFGYVKKVEDFGDSGDCLVNVNCSPEGDSWQDEKTGVALILIGGTRMCSGSLINNTCNDGDLLFLTADHCLYGLDAINNPNADTWSFIWNYEAPNCDNPLTEPSLNITNGATLLANSAFTDFALFRLT